MYTHKQNNSFVGQRATLNDQGRLYSNWYRTINLFSSDEQCCHCVIEPSVVCCQSQSIFSILISTVIASIKRLNKIYTYQTWRMIDWYRSEESIRTDVSILTALPLYQCRSKVLPLWVLRFFALSIVFGRLSSVFTVLIAR